MRSARPAGVDPACAPLESGFCAMVDVRSRLTVRTARHMFETSRSCRTARPPHRPMWSASERRSRASFRQLPDSDRLIDRAGCQDARSLRRTHLPRSTAKIDAFGAALRCRPFIAITNAANRESTFNMGRRIMAERGRKRGKRARRVPPVVRRAATASMDAPDDDALRALARVLARQAAREVFESEWCRTTSAVH